MKYFVEASVTRKFAGISAPYKETICKLVNANRYDEAKAKYENWVRQHYAHSMPVSVDFEYIRFADEIQ